MDRREDLPGSGGDVTELEQREQRELWRLVNTAWPLLARNKDTVPGAEKWLREYGKLVSQEVDGP